MDSYTYLVTGGLGCLGAWTLFHLVRQGQQAVCFDIGHNSGRLDLLLTPAEKKNVTFVTGDLIVFDEVHEVMERQHVTHIVHLAALQIPFCRANPVLGAQVNVVGTVNVFEAARQLNIGHLAYASSVAVYGPPADYPPGPVAEDAPTAPRTLYGGYKVTNEANARVYWQDYGLSSIALRPHTIYGVGRDQGLTSDPTKAMLAAAAGRPFHINFGGAVQLQWASDVAQQFIDAATQPLSGAYVFNLAGPTVATAEIVTLIQQVRRKANVTYGEEALPFPAALDDTGLRQSVTAVYETSLAEGVGQTIAHFEACLRDGRLVLS